MSLNVAFRVDASRQIGTGHAMRCLTLASALRERGAHIRFISRYMPDHLRLMIEVAGYEFVLLQSIGETVVSEDAHAAWLGTTQDADARDSIHALADLYWDWLLIDHYALDVRWESLLRLSAQSIFVIDDLADRIHDCDMLLDQNFFSDMHTRYIGKTPDDCTLLLGPRYILLRNEFRLWRDLIAPRQGPVVRVLVFFGGIDLDNNTMCAIETMATKIESGMHVDVVVGVDNPRCEEIKNACHLYGFTCHIQINHIAELMAKADLAIGACGFSSYEFAAMLLPAMLLPTTNIQAVVANDFHEHGLAFNLGFEKLTSNRLMDAWNVIAPASELRLSMSLACADLVDPQGVMNVVEKMFVN